MAGVPERGLYGPMLAPGAKGNVMFCDGFMLKCVKLVNTEYISASVFYCFCAWTVEYHMRIFV